MKVFNFIVKNRIWVFIFYILIIPFCFYSWKNTHINTSLTSYLPQDLDSVKGQKILEQYFHSSSSAFIYLEGFENIKYINEIIEKISLIDGIKGIYSTKSFGVLTVPPEFLPENIRSQFYSKEGSLITIQFKYGPEDKRTFETVRKIKENLKGYKNLYFGGFAVINEESNREVRSNTQDIALYITIFAIFIFLTFNTGSFIEAFLFLFSLAIAYVINMGTNFFFKEISYLSSGLTGALQLGVSIDYSIFLFHRFEEEFAKDLKKEIDKAMVKALNYTYKSIFTSSITTLIGFLAITVMSIRIGYDLGLILAKGIFFTLFTTLTLMPCLLIIFYPLIKKTKINFNFLKNLNKRFHYKIENKVKNDDRRINKGNKNFFYIYKFKSNRFILFIIFVVLITISSYGYFNVPISYQINDTYPSNLDSIKDSIYIIDKTGSGDIISLIVKIDKFDDFENYQYNLMISELKDIYGIETILHVNFGRSFLEPLSFLSKSTLKSFYQENYLVCHLKLKFQPGTNDSYRTIEKIFKKVSEYYKEYYLAGQGVLVYDFARLTKVDFMKINSISLILIFITLIVSFFSISLPLLLIIIIELAIFLNFSFNFIAGKPISFITQTILGSIQLGATIDYGVLYLNRLFDEIREGKTKFDAIYHASVSTFLPILSASLCLFIAVTTYGFFSNYPIVKDITKLIGRGAIISFLTVVIFSPLLCYLLYNRISFVINLRKKLFKLEK
ncbi:MAG: MMPL family transporter [Spirochaetes bacterium]|nr:MMPL family transporter [Spirochaetota bacterium]